MYYLPRIWSWICTAGISHTSSRLELCSYWLSFTLTIRPSAFALRIHSACEQQTRAPCQRLQMKPLHYASFQTAHIICGEPWGGGGFEQAIHTPVTFNTLYYNTLGSSYNTLHISYVVRLFRNFQRYMCRIYKWSLHYIFCLQSSQKRLKKINANKMDGFLMQVKMKWVSLECVVTSLWFLLLTN